MRKRLLNISDILGDRDLAALLEMASWKRPTQVVVDLDSDAWKAWAKGFEPPETAVVHVPTQPQQSPVVPTPGPGDVVEIILAKIGYTKRGGCGCEAFKAQMNEWGYLQCCTIHFPEIVRWFAAKAQEIGVKLTAAGLLAELKRVYAERGATCE